MDWNGFRSVDSWGYLQKLSISLCFFWCLFFGTLFWTLNRGFGQDKGIAEQNGMHHWIRHALMSGEKIIRAKIFAWVSATNEIREKIIQNVFYWPG